MKIRFHLFLIYVFLFNLSVFAQKIEARKILALDYPITCGYFNALMDSAYQEYLQQPKDLKLYVIFYGEKNYEARIWNNKTNILSETRVLNPRYDDALNRAKEVPLYLETAHKFPKNRIALINGGFREKFELELWIVPKGAEPPKPNPTVDKKDVKFRKGRPRQVRNCARAYEYYEKTDF